MKISPGNRVKIIRSGDVIPKILGCYDKNDEAFFVEFKLPSTCPVCNSPTERGMIESNSSSNSNSSSSSSHPSSPSTQPGVIVRCTGGLLCSAQAIESINHFASRDAVDIKGLGPAIIQELYNLGLVKTPADLYRLKYKNSIESNDTLKLVIKLFQHTNT
jgi:DNA ligase (NAD+)